MMLVGLLINVLIVIAVVGSLYVLLKKALLETRAAGNAELERKLDRVIELLEKQSKE